MPETKKNYSIHPRNWNGKHGPIKNTAAPNKNRPDWVRRMKNYDARQRAHQATLASLSSSTPPTAFRRPGSMKV